MSFREQGYDRETTEAIAALERLNAAYEAQFGFRFCVFVAGRSRRGPRAGARGGARRATARREIASGPCGDVVAIARDRFAAAPKEASAA